ncbi:major facilitator superfamily transporter [Colletotrichum tofieldiae]|uniref:Major facilitator superfamily transporter n=1 Tax=Colletotrichum tofieldiae TaxID=708197 RepID=A0A166VNW8_9PEZI|nr:major facilitator superfamily transporter [Colletotrichum tofieldiae]
MAPTELRHETIDLDDLSDHIKASRSDSQRPWPRRHEIKNNDDWHVIEVNSEGSKEWERYPKPDETFTAHPSPLKTAVPLKYSTNFLHPATPDGQESTFSRGGDDFNDTISLTARSHRDGSKKASRFVWWTFGLWLLGALMMTLTTVYSTGSAKALMRLNFFVTSSKNSLLILRVLTELCAVTLAALVVVVVEDLQWALASRPGGVSLLHFVGLDSGTGVWGLLRLLATADWKHKYSSLFRLLVICSIPLPGIILMGAISIDMVTFPEKTYNVSAGIAPFNASYVYEIRQSTATALLVQMGSPAWSDRDSFSLDPLDDGAGRCVNAEGKWAACDESHLLTGGIVSVAPQADDLKQYRGSSAYVVPKTRVVQLEYGKVHDLNGLRATGNCFLLGAVSAASYWCTDVGKGNELLFGENGEIASYTSYLCHASKLTSILLPGSAYCPISLQTTSSCLNNTDWTNPLVLSSSLFVYSRLATITYDRGNFSILSVTDMTPPKQEVIGLDEYMLSLSAVVPGFNKSAAATQGDNSALAIYAVTALPINDSEVAKKQSLKAIRKAMSVPFHYFHANYFSAGPSIWELSTPREGLTDDMYTTLSISILSHQVVAGKVSRWLFVLVSGSILLLSAGIIVATSRVCGKRPDRCGYPTLDFAAVCAVKGGMTPASGDWRDRPEAASGQATHVNGLYRSLTEIGQKPKPFEVAKNIKNDRVIIG